MRIFIFTSLLLMLYVSQSQAQQEAMFTQYMHNEVTINPAYAGSHDAVSLTALYRHQWMKMEGAPRTFSFNAHAPVGEKVGLGLALINDQISIYEDLNLFGMYSYKIALSEKSSLRLGLQAGMINRKTDYGQLSPKNGVDDNFTGGMISNFHVNIGTGAFFSMEKFYVGLSVPKLVNNRSEYGGDLLHTQQKHIFLTTGYVFDLAPEIKLKPSLFYKYTQGAPMQLDLTANLIFREVLWTGFSWRSHDSVDLLLGVQASKQLYFGYAYDFATSKLGDYHNGSHEILLNYRLGFSSNRVLTPRYY